ncbi:hypothetical protein CEQ90_09495 [Lewinellaceae bacterium SD302]|nr:hypothetical protein CEQ90_09495 [Lewinellaceae bacterium SD302]
MATEYLTIRQISSFHRCEETLIVELIECGVCQSSNVAEDVTTIKASDLPRLEKALRIYEELGVNPAGIHIILNLLDRIEQLSAGPRPPVDDL